MVPDEPSIRQAGPGFTISPGTQVVLKVRKALATGEEYRKAGSVGIVVESPPAEGQPYVVHFADGSTVQATADELALRRREVEDELAATEVDLRSHIIYRCQVGSKAYGLAVEDSDDDLRGIYLPPARLHWSLYRLPEQIESQGAQGDEVYWELEKFLRLALKANPTVLETLWTPMVLDATPLARELRGLRDAFLSRHIYKTYSGYVLSQFRRMARAQDRHGAYKPKHAMHLIRLLLAGIEALETRQIPVEVREHRAELMRIRAGALGFEEVKARALELDRSFRKAFARSDLPEQPDYRRVDDFLVRARRSAVDD